MSFIVAARCAISSPLAGTRTRSSSRPIEISDTRDRTLGARPRQLRAFVLSEAALLLGGGLVGGAAIGALLSWVLIRTLSGVFDPPPQTATAPWSYLAGVAAAILTAALTSATISARHNPVTAIREL